MFQRGLDTPLFSCYVQEVHYEFSFMLIATAPTPPAEVKWVCHDCTPSEKYVLNEVQKKTNVTDRYALATILGNIKSESSFHANICEGGARVPYNRCYRGGYGIIQWTSTNRYLGLGKFGKRYGCDPSTLKCQVRYMFTEPQFRSALRFFEVPGKSLSYYNQGAYRWLGWGIKGYRQVYAQRYANRLTVTGA